MKIKGKLIVIEGLDGSGKATQSAKLLDWMENREGKAIKVSFPDYRSPSSFPVKMYLEGKMGSTHDVNAYAASSFYSVDRFVSYQTGWKKQYTQGYTIIADRYTTSNAVHQMVKLPPEQRDEYLCWLQDIEYVRFGLPRPDVVIYLDMDVSVSKQLLDARRASSQADIHEGDLVYLESCRESAIWASNRLGWKIIRCDDGSAPFTVEEIFKKIIEALGESIL